MPTIVGILTFMSGKNSILGLSEPKNSRISRYSYTYEHLKFHTQLSWAWKKFYNLGARPRPLLLLWFETFGPPKGFLTDQWINTENNQLTDKTYGESEIRTRQKQCIVTPEDPWSVKQHLWNTEAKENQQLNPNDQAQTSKQLN